MAYSIALSGKGGVGKTTIAALIVRHLIETTGKSVLAVDADPNSSLGAALGVEVAGSVADIREDILERKQEFNVTGASKEREIEYRIQQSIIEAKGFDLLTMGRPEGPHCYCFVNSILRRYLDTVGGEYPFTVMDNEPGMEHLSRRTTNNVDLLLVVADPTTVGVEAARRIFAIADELSILVKSRAFILNRVPDSGISPRVRERITAAGLQAAAEIPSDPTIFDASAEGRSVFELPQDNATFRAIAELIQRLTFSPEKAIKSAR
jgi:CO dehydrogenase maturation factor